MGAEPVFSWDALRKAPALEPAWKTLALDHPQPAGEAFVAAVDALLKAPDPSPSWYRSGEKALQCACLWQRSQVAVGDGVVSSAEPLLTLRRAWLTHHVQRQEWVEANELADRWLTVYQVEPPLRDAIRSLWLAQADLAAGNGNWRECKRWLDRVEAEFPSATLAGRARLDLRSHVEALIAEARDQPLAVALPKLERARDLDPRLPGVRDQIENLKQTARTLTVGVRSLPQGLSPATAWTDVEKQTLNLVFERLVLERSDGAPRFRLQLAQRLPELQGTELRCTLRTDAFWANGVRVQPADVRHSVEFHLRTHGEAREALTLPRLHRDTLTFSLKQGVVDPIRLLAFPMVPSQPYGKPLLQADDPAFAAKPLGSGPYQLAERTKTMARFHANPYYVREGVSEPGAVRDVVLMDWHDPQTAKARPDLLWDVDADQRPGLAAQGYREVRALKVPRVHALAINARHGPLQQAAIRRALGLGIERKALLAHFAGAGEPALHHVANGPFPAGSWANAPAARVPADLQQLDLARSLAQKNKAEIEGAAWTLKYPAEDARVTKAMEQLVQDLTTRFRDSGVGLRLTAVPVAPQQLRKDLEARDFDLAYVSFDQLDDPLRLWALFDPHRTAVAPGGGNVLGYDSDATLQTLLRIAQRQRQPTALQETLQTVHVHLVETMPFIPLWQLDVLVAKQASLQTPPLDPLALFADVAEWKLSR